VTTLQPDLKGAGLRIGIVWSRFNEEIVRQLLTACDKELVELGVAASSIDVVSVPGALEIPVVLQSLALERRGFGRRYDALIALGAVIRGRGAMILTSSARCGARASVASLPAALHAAGRFAREAAWLKRARRIATLAHA